MDNLVSLQCFDNVGRKGFWPVKVGGWFVDGVDLTEALHVL